MSIYTATATTDGHTYTLFDGSDTSNGLLLSGSITQAVNQIDSFTFSLPMGSSAYSSIKSMLTTVKVYRGSSLMFKGRVINVNNSMSSTGQITKEVTCEGLLGYTHDGVIPAKSLVAGTLSNVALSSIISSHNDTSGHEFKVGDYGDIQGLYEKIEMDYCDTYEALQTIMVDGYGGEIRARYDSENKNDVIDYSPTGFGEKSTTTIKLAVNMKEITQKVDASNIVTRLYAYGAKGTSGYRLTMSLLGQTDNQEYIQDDDLVETYGILPAVEFFDIGSGWTASTEGGYATELYNAAAEYFETLKNPSTEYEVSALDLSTIEAGFETFELYNTYHVVNSLMGISAYLRVTGITYDLLEPQNSSLTFTTVSTS